MKKHILKKSTSKKEIEFHFNFYNKFITLQEKMKESAMTLHLNQDESKTKELEIINEEAHKNFNDFLNETI